MKFLIQRTRSSSVHIAGELVGETTRPGMLILVGISPQDGDDDIHYLIKKAIQLRIFPDEAGVMNRSLLDVKGEVLLVSQFTLMAQTKKGNRPSYIEAAPPAMALPLYERLIGQMEEALGRPIATGRFGADMQVSLVNDGPVTILLDSHHR